MTNRQFQVSGNAALQPVVFPLMHIEVSSPFRIEEARNSSTISLPIGPATRAGVRFTLAAVPSPMLIPMTVHRTLSTPCDHLRSFTSFSVPRNLVNVCFGEFFLSRLSSPFRSHFLPLFPMSADVRSCHSVCQGSDRRVHRLWTCTTATSPTETEPFLHFRCPRPRLSRQNIDKFHKHAVECIHGRFLRQCLCLSRRQQG